MKNLKLLALIPTLVLSLAGCSNNNEHQYKDDFTYDAPLYEPLNLAGGDATIMRMEILGIPSSGVKAAAWDEYNIKVRCHYDNDRLKDFPFKVVNIPLDMRHYFGEVGEHHIYLYELKYISNFTINVIENPDWDGYTCEFYDKDKNYLTTQKVGFYEEVIYNGPEVPAQQDDFAFQYNFVGWNQPTTYIHQDMQFKAKYEMVEKRYYANKPYNNDHIGISALVDEDGKHGSGLVYLGRVRHVPTIYSEVKELESEDLEFSLTNIKDFGQYWNEYNQNIINNSLLFEETPEYDSSIYGRATEIIGSPNFLVQFDNRYNYKGVKALLDDRSDVILASNDPFATVLERSSHYVNEYVAKVSKDDEPGYYRYAVVMSFDVYLSVSFTKIDSHRYELGSYNNFIISPVNDSQNSLVQYSKDGEFDGNFDTKLSLSTKILYHTAEMINWGN